MPSGRPKKTDPPKPEDPTMFNCDGTPIHLREGMIFKNGLGYTIEILSIHEGNSEVGLRRVKYKLDKHFEYQVYNKVIEKAVAALGNTTLKSPGYSANVWQLTNP